MSIMSRLFGGSGRTAVDEQPIPLEKTPFEPRRKSGKEGLLYFEEVEDRVGSDAYLHVVRKERTEGELLEITNVTKSFFRIPDDKIVKGVNLRIRDSEGVEGRVYVPEEFPSRLDRRAILGQQVAYEHESERLCERFHCGDNKSHKYSLTILTGPLEGEEYSRDDIVESM